MTGIPERWLESGRFAEIAGFRLKPREYPWLPGIPLASVRGQAQAFYLQDEYKLEFILKKFLPSRVPNPGYLKSIQPLVPRRSGFQSGYLRRVLSKADLGTNGFFTPDFASWIENTVLMPRVSCRDWVRLADNIRSGRTTLPDNERLAMCRFLSEHVLCLESNNLSHRNLSCTKVFIDENNHILHLIDWDEMFHPSLTKPAEISGGTCGYITPLAKKDPYGELTWRTFADRFSLAILNTEFLCMSPSSPLTYDGGMFDQQEIYNRGGPGVRAILSTLDNNFQGADVLLSRALDARAFDDCPNPAEWIAFCGGVPSLVDPLNRVAPMQFYSCFISYNHRDQDFAQRLYSRLRDSGIRVWFALEDARAGVKLFPQVDQAIQMHDRLLLVLSENSLHSNWVEREIRMAREFEKRGGRQKLFPIRLTNYETLAQWQCLDAVTAEDLAEEVRSYFIPDFSNWKNHDDFERAFARLLDALKQSERG